jgi:hypothetical protein
MDFYWETLSLRQCIVREFIGGGDMQGDTLYCEKCKTRSAGPLNNEDGSLQRCPNCYVRIYCHGSIGYESREEMRRYINIKEK